MGGKSSKSASKRSRKSIKVEGDRPVQEFEDASDSGHSKTVASNEVHARNEASVLAETSDSRIHEKENPVTIEKDHRFQVDSEESDSWVSKKLSDISNKIKERSPQQSKTPEQVSQSVRYETPSPPVNMSIGYVSSDGTPESSQKFSTSPSPMPETPWSIETTSRSVEASSFGNAESARKLSISNPPPVFESIMDETDENLMQAILDAEV